MKTDQSDIYIDLCNLHKILYRAQFTMTKGDRIIMGNRLLDLNQNCVSITSRAINAPTKSERLEHIDQLNGEFDALRLNLQACADLHLFKDSRSTVDRLNQPSQNVSRTVLSIFEVVGKIDEQIGRWRNKTRRDLPRDSGRQTDI